MNWTGCETEWAFARNCTVASLGKPSPKLRAYGAETRGLIPIERHLAMEMRNDSDATESAMKQTTLAFITYNEEVQGNLSHDLPEWLQEFSARSGR